MLMYKTSPVRALGAPGLGGDEAQVLRRAGVGDGLPFLLGPDGSYDLELNRFVRELDGWGVRSEHTREAYARDLMLFGRFLHEHRGGRSIWDAGQDDLRAYKRARRRTKGFTVSASTWNRFIAALDKWVKRAIHEELIEAQPFRMVEKTVLTPRGLVRVLFNAEREVEDSAGPVRFLAYEDYLVWRDVGLRGQLPDGSPDPSWRGRHGERNAVFADLLVCTGMRLREASSLLVTEVPPLAQRRLTGDLNLPATITKRSRPRTVFVSRRVLRDLHHYVDIERDELVERRRAAGAYGCTDAWMGVRSAGKTALTLVEDGRSRPYSRVTIEERQRLCRVGDDGPGGPLWLWLGEDGLPLSRSTWQAVFRRANERCARFGLDLVVHPHALRHTFAVHMLGLLLRQTVRALRMEPGETLMSQQVKRLLVGDPLRKLQLLLGHRQRETVFVYLDVLDEAQEIVLSALREWDEQAEALSRVRLEDGAAA